MHEEGAYEGANSRYSQGRTHTMHIRGRPHLNDPVQAGKSKALEALILQGLGASGWIEVSAVAAKHTQAQIAGFRERAVLELRQEGMNVWYGVTAQFVDQEALGFTHFMASHIDDVKRIHAPEVLSAH